MVSSDSKFQASLLNFIKLPCKRLPILENFPELSTTVIKDKYFTSMRRLNNIFQLGLQV